MIMKWSPVSGRTLGFIRGRAAPGIQKSDDLQLLFVAFLLLSIAKNYLPNFAKGVLTR